MYFILDILYIFSYYVYSENFRSLKFPINAVTSAVQLPDKNTMKRFSKLKNILFG